MHSTSALGVQTRTARSVTKRWIFSCTPFIRFPSFHLTPPTLSPAQPFCVWRSVRVPHSISIPLVFSRPPLVRIGLKLQILFHCLLPSILDRLSTSLFEVRKYLFSCKTELVMGCLFSVPATKPLRPILFQTIFRTQPEAILRSSRTSYGATTDESDCPAHGNSKILHASCPCSASQKEAEPRPRQSSPIAIDNSASAEATPMFLSQRNKRLGRLERVNSHLFMFFEGIGMSQLLITKQNY